MSTLQDRLPSGSVGARRGQVLARLREAAGPVTVAEIAEATELHVNTARFHLDGLVEQGYAERRAEERDTPGRPRVLYEARAQADAPRSYRLLSRMLAGLVAQLDVGDAAVEAGRAWGRELVDRPDGGEAPDPEDAVARLVGLMDDVGFRPELRTHDETEVALHSCPFLEVAVEHGDVVCAMHLGLMEGALDALDVPVRVDSLVPFATPHSCVARLLGPGAG